MTILIHYIGIYALRHLSNCLTIYCSNIMVLPRRYENCSQRWKRWLFYNGHPNYDAIFKVLHSQFIEWKEHALLHIDDPLEKLSYNDHIMDYITKKSGIEQKGTKSEKMWCAASVAELLLDLSCVNLSIQKDKLLRQRPNPHKDGKGLSPIFLHDWFRSHRITFSKNDSVKLSRLNSTPVVMIRTSWRY